MTTRTPPPTTFTDAEKINPYQVLIDLYDHAIGLPVELSRDDALAELALAAAVVAWWSRWQPALFHAALRAGADLTDIAAATDLDINEVVHRWRRWTDVQTRMEINGCPLLDPDEVRTIHDGVPKETSL